MVRIMHLASTRTWDLYLIRRLLLDDRNIPALGRIGDPDDIIASVRVENGEVSLTNSSPSYLV